MNFPKAYADRVAKLRVPGGFVLVAAFAWFSHPNALWLCYGVPVSFMGLALRAWAAGHLAKNQELTTSGPYRFLRNPLYIGTLLVAAGLVVASGFAAGADDDAGLFVADFAAVDFASCSLARSSSSHLV